MSPAEQICMYLICKRPKRTAVLAAASKPKRCMSVKAVIVVHLMLSLVCLPGFVQKQTHFVEHGRL